ncbi:shikimate dehydrogenase [Halochromatium glycolicum]|uniref:Shikimate dehydrogenase (NADP(+)) n=1 Tax=Halochromatium glycolicum TaxID=85075 RepID=A0AAJ0XCQ8_9GAMM|nr:shikimate dehydrogenase [Halochromatium glycolicum]MBK1707405.1 shikimate dehydrogenase [Halochromatium glycolicum]
MTDRYAVIGHPIEHSKSPQIHAAFAAQTGEPLEYGRILGNLNDFAGDVRRFVAEGGRGLNVTVPFKTEAFELLEDLSAHARAAGAVNTLIVRDGGLLRGDNTDGIGLIRDLTVNHSFALAGRRVLLLGAGGAARGVLRPLLEAEPAALVIANRTAAKAEALASELATATTHHSAFRRQPDPASQAQADSTTTGQPNTAARAATDVSGCGLEALAGQRFDLIINATSTGLEGGVPAIPDDCLTDSGWVYDMLYADEPTPFCRWGQRHGAAQALDGLGMLVEQAAESFWLWRGVRPQTAPVIESLRGA